MAGFGTGSTGKIKIDIKNNVQVAEKYDENGVIVDMTTHGGKTTTTTTEFSDDAVENTALNGQAGTEVVTDDDYALDAQGYMQRTVTKVKALPAKVA
jgi:hypothetical protein